jgi:AmpE protein
MATVLLAVLVAIVLSHSIPELGRLRHYGWYEGWLRGDLNPLVGSATWNGRYGGWWSVGLPVLLVGLLQWLMAGQAYGFPSFLLATAVLFYCWGPRDLDADIGAVTHAADRDTRVSALQDIPTDPPQPPLALDGRTLVDTVFRAALTRWFGVLFWFLLLGAAGALMYRLVQLAAQSEAHRSALPRAHADALRDVHIALDWPAAQLMTLALALAADFDAVAQSWRDFHHGIGQGYLVRDVGFLFAAARASVDAEDEDFDDEAANTTLLPLHQSQSLIWRILVVWLAVLAMFVLAGWIG